MAKFLFLRGEIFLERYICSTQISSRVCARVYPHDTCVCINTRAQMNIARIRVYIYQPTCVIFFAIDDVKYGRRKTDDSNNVSNFPLRYFFRECDKRKKNTRARIYHSFKSNYAISSPPPGKRATSSEMNYCIKQDFFQLFIFFIVKRKRCDSLELSLRLVFARERNKRQKYDD